jgi:uncharacterized membrane protein
MSDQTTSEGVAGVGMFVAAFLDEKGAKKALKGMKEAKKSGEFYYDNAAVIHCNEKGKVKIDETGDMSTGKGAGIGALVGGVIGLLGGPIGVVAGAGAGALAALKDSGFDDKSLKEIGSALPPGTSAIAVTTSRKFVEQVRKQAPHGETLAVARDLASDIRNNLKAGQEVVYSLLLTEEGVAASKVVASDEAVAVFGIAASEEGVVAGQAVVTAEGAAYEAVAATEDEAVYEAGVIVPEEDEGGEEE